MNTAKFRAALVATLALLALVSAQITFSRDWTGGKRSAPQLALDCGEFARLCRHFIHELKSTMTSEAGASSDGSGAGAASRRHRVDDSSLLYDDDK